MMTKHGLSRIEMPNGAVLELDEEKRVTRHSPSGALQVLLT
jgi:hypothetical protein